MPTLKLATYNVNNLFDRFDDPYNIKDDQYYRAQQTSAKPHIKRFYQARIIEQMRPDVMAFQEVENRQALWEFNMANLGGYFEHLTLIEANDFRGIDVAVASVSRYPPGAVTTHQFRQYLHGTARRNVFSRDILESEIFYYRRGKLYPIFTLFVTHLKSQFINNRLSPSRKREAYQRNERLRYLQAQEVRNIVARRFPDRQSARYAIAGDFNDHPESIPLSPLLEWEGVVNPIANLPLDQRYTHRYRGHKEQLDYILLSPALHVWLDADSVTAVHPVDRVTDEDEQDTEIRGASTASDHYMVFLKLDIPSDALNEDTAIEIAKWPEELNIEPYEDK